MNKKLIIALFLALSLVACKKEETTSVLQEKYVPTVKQPTDDGKNYEVVLNARALQVGERGEWTLLSGEVVEDFVYFENKENPFTVFKGIPGEEYKLEWTHWDATGKSTKIQTTVNIPLPKIEIRNTTDKVYSTLVFLEVDSKYKGKWSFDKPFGHLSSTYFDGYSSETEAKPSIVLHGYSNTNYTATYSYVYAGKTYKFQKQVNTGEYKEIEGLFELFLSPESPKVTMSREGSVLELNLQASSSGSLFNSPEIYPALRSFKNLRNLNLGGSSLQQIPDIFGESYRNLEVLDLDGVGTDLLFPESFGNLVKLKKLILSPLYTSSSRTIIMPSSFGNLKSLEYFSFSYDSGYINFNGTLGKLKNLEYLSANLTDIPNDIGNLKKLQTLLILVRNSAVPESLSDCSSLTSLRLNLFPLDDKKQELPINIGKLKKLEFLDLQTAFLYSLPASFGDLTALKFLTIESLHLETLPENFGKLSNLEELTLNGKFSKLPDSFGSLHKLKSLSLRGTLSYLPDSFGELSELEFFEPNSPLIRLPESFGKLKKLTIAKFNRCKLESLPISFGGLDALTELDLSNNNLKKFPVSLIPLKSITRIYLNSNDLDNIPDEISKMRSGVTIALRNVPKITQERLLYLKKITKNMVFDSDFGYLN